MVTEEDDRRFMAAAIRLSLRHLGLTDDNPSVGALIVAPDGTILGRGVTALGGRPHAETQALAEAGERARGATAYVTLEPCAHHGRTPPCAEALVAAGVSRVVGGAGDPDPRVAGRGYAILRAGGVAVTEGVSEAEARSALPGYLMRAERKRPYVTLKLALSPDDMIGRMGNGQLPITGAIARAQVQMLRATNDAILVGIGTALADDPLLTVRLAGLETRSPKRFVLDRSARLPLASALVRSADFPSVTVIVGNGASGKTSLAAHGVAIMSAELAADRFALAPLLTHLAETGVSTLMVEGGADTARAFLADNLVDRIVLFRGTSMIGAGSIASPLRWDETPPGFRLARESRYGDDLCREWERTS
ncbi:MAG: bifunctional diaminohydroxyphosphoribosylaminopyrimidine deaminase/5-amino-6-(5-phosphoribosylamino)uracil reductase RibD [Mesorhizobium amorphae]|nr:MAG: bifunctional diaminohydroxyphosphoribosylaminopyrimidine deaminase/5-amino-6-(5-phosphoribosylamino)uracil reductase RibD [Mesorhizobium amorphae]